MRGGESALAASVVCMNDTQERDVWMLTRPAKLIRARAAVALLATILLYRQVHGNWLLFAVLFMTPDLLMLGYLVSVRLGAALYNLAHTLLLPVLLVATCLLTHERVLLPFALIWIAHITFDRALGYGLKYPTHFKDTHLQHI